MSLPLLALVVLVALGLGYRFYGGLVARQYRLDGRAVTPAQRHNDGVDFVPTRPVYLLPQHFSAIAAAGPIAGPILACQQFGWLPCLLWIGLGVIFIGAVHDFSILIASVRHDGRSIAEVVKANLGQRAYLAIMAFIWVALLYVILAFTDVTASTFVSGDADMRGLGFRFNPGGAVAAASLLYLGLAVLLGARQPLLAAAALAEHGDLRAGHAGGGLAGNACRTVLILDAKTWAILILAYCFIASLVPVWALLQPRGYLGGFVLYLAMAVGIVGIFLGDFPIQQETFRGFEMPGATGALFPFLFVTIACGACSGFHGLVCSGTTSKQIERETHCKPIGYGAMLLEGFVALIALGHHHDRGDGRHRRQGAGRHLRARARPLPHRHHRRETSDFCRHLRRDGVLDLRLRHARCQHAPGPLHPAGAARLARSRRRDRRHRGHLYQPARDSHAVGCWQLPAVLDPVWHLQPAAGRAVAPGDHRLAASLRADLHVHADPGALRSGHHADGAGAPGTQRASPAPSAG